MLMPSLSPSLSSSSSPLLLVLKKGMGSESCSEWVGHAVVFAWPGQGHLNPLFCFSQILASHGFCITFVHTHHNLQRASSSLPPSSANFRLVGIPDGLPPDHPRDVLALIRATDGPSQPLPTAFEQLVDRLVHQEHNPATCIVSDFFMAFTQDVANKFALPRVGVYVQSASSFGCHLAVSDGFRPSQGASVIDCIPGVPPLKLDEMISFLQCYDPSDALFDFMIRAFKRIHEPAWVLVNTFDKLEHDVMEALQNRRPVQCVGPLLLPSFQSDRSTGASDDIGTSLWPEQHDCIRWLDSQPPSSVLYVSFGSLATLSAKQTEELALGLESSQQPFLWAIREGSVEAGLPEGWKGRVQDRACFVSWAPQLKVLKHSATGGFLTHCGWNSTLESIAAGVPMLGWADFADQQLNRRCVVDMWGVGLMLSGEGEGGEWRREEVERKVRMLMVERRASLMVQCDALRDSAAAATAGALPCLIDEILADLSMKKMKEPQPAA